MRRTRATVLAAALARVRGPVLNAPRVYRVRAVPLLVAVTAIAACRDGGADPLGPADVAGRYVLATVSGEPVPTAGLGAVLSGEIFLGEDGAATRRVRYATSGLPGGVEDAAAGTFTVRGDSVVLHVTVLASRPPVAVRWAAARQGSMLTLRFFSPNDGPDILEVYRRQ